MGDKIKYGNISIAPNEIDPDGSQYDLYKKNQSSTDSEGSVEIPTCTVRFVPSEGGSHNGFYTYTRYENGVITPVSSNEDEWVNEFDITMENVICGTVILFGWSYDGDAGKITIDGGAECISNGLAVNETSSFRAPMTPGEVCTIEVGNHQGW